MEEAEKADVNNAVPLQVLWGLYCAAQWLHLMVVKYCLTMEKSHEQSASLSVGLNFKCWCQYFKHVAQVCDL